VRVTKKKVRKPEKWEIEAMQTLRKRIFDLEQDLLRTEKEKQAAYLEAARSRHLWITTEDEVQKGLERFKSVSFKARLIWIRIGQFLRIIDECDHE
jgi:hypothetical protein